LNEFFRYACDITDQSLVKELVNAVHRKFGQIDVLINNAGVIECGPAKGRDSESAFASSRLTLLAEAAAVRNNEIA
jgi:NADP-dependent 3-hydroxy acid dehydrogenase YdfG